jgi:hypothetical protein
MNAPTVRRGAGGKLLPGSVLNPGGRPRGAIEEVRELLGPHTPEFVAALVELVRSQNEATRLAAIREAFDRLLGKPPVAVDTTVAKVDLGALYLQALQRVNDDCAPSDPIDVTPMTHPPTDEPAADATDQADDAW